MKETLELIKKHGATAVLVIWLFNTHKRVEQLETKLYDCLRYKPYNSENISPMGILPKKIDYETETNS